MWQFSWRVSGVQNPIQGMCAYTNRVCVCVCVCACQCVRVCVCQSEPSLTLPRFPLHISVCRDEAREWAALTVNNAVCLLVCVRHEARHEVVNLVNLDANGDFSTRQKQGRSMEGEVVHVPARSCLVNSDAGAIGHQRLQKTRCTVYSTPSQPPRPLRLFTLL